MGRIKNLYKISEHKIPKITPKIILISQLENAINIVSFNLFINVIMISLLIFGFIAEIVNSLNISIPPLWKLIKSSYAIGMQTKTGRNVIEEGVNFNFFN